MRNHPYVVVISGSPSEADFLKKALDDLEIRSFFPQRDIQLGENLDQRVRAELDTADAVLVGTSAQEVFSEFKELEGIKSRKSTDRAFKIIPVVPSSQVPPAPPDWLQGVKPLLYAFNDPSGTMRSLVRSLTPGRETDPEETLDELLTEAERLVLRLKSTYDQYRHSRNLLGISFVVFASGVGMLTYGIRTGAGNPLSGFFQFFGLVVLALGGYFSFHSIVNWSSNYQRFLLSRRLLEEGSSVISASKSFLKTRPVTTEDSSKQADTGRGEES